MANDVVRTVITNVSAQIALELGATYSELPYVNDVSMNNFENNHNRYGVLADASTETDTVTRAISVNQAFEVVLTKAYIDDSISDVDAREKWLDLQALMLDIYKRLVNTNAGSPGVVIDVKDLAWEEPEYLVDQKIVVMHASINIRYRFLL